MILIEPLKLNMHIVNNKVELVINYAQRVAYIYSVEIIKYK